MSLIVEFVKRYKTRQEALTALNNMYGLKVKLNRLHEWYDPDNARELPVHIANSLRGYMLGFLLDKEGIHLSGKKLTRLIKNLS